MTLIAGFDEVGRGAWAGPLLVCGVVLEQGQFAGLRDSKQLNNKRRAALTKDLLPEVEAVNVYWISPEGIDAMGLGLALKEGFVECAKDINADSYIIDGTIDYLTTNTSQAVIKGDESVPAVAAASIIAKYYRDTYMKLVDTLHPNYGFGNHVGYGTAAHSAALSKLGVTSLHRKSFKPVAKHV